MHRPNFFIVGAPKSGTTSLYDSLCQHPDVFMPEWKEPWYFGRDFDFDPMWCVRDEDAYLKLFEKAGSSKRIGEASVFNLYSTTAAEEIKAFEPSSKIIIMLRNPAELVYSIHGQYLWNCNEDIEDFEEAFAAQADRKKGLRIPQESYFVQGLFYSDVAGYTQQVKRYYNTFGKDHVLVLTFDDFVKDVPGCYRRVLDFLDLDDFTPQFRHVNPTSPIQFRPINKFIIHRPRLRRTISKVLSPRAKRWILMVVPKLINPQAKRPKLSPEIRAKLSVHFRKEIEDLGRLLGRDLSAWHSSK